MAAKNRMAQFIECALLAGSLGICAQLQAAEPEPKHIEFFEQKIRPVLVQHCYKCHGEGNSVKGGLRLSTREGILRGGDTGPAIVPGKPAESELIAAIRHESVEMPPKKKLPDEVIADFVHWIEIGAPDPRDGDVSAPKSYAEIDFEAARQHWSFRPPILHSPPSVHKSEWLRGEVDQFVLARLEKSGLAPSPDAERSTWLRRVTLDLTGLLPTPKQQLDFEQDKREDAKDRVVDRLLASPQFGERWGRHWLDVARYGESTGKERNAPYLQAWLYRDWVIEALNDDKSYDQFLQEQLAGDLLPATSPEQRREQLTATGFLAVGIKSLNERIPDAYMLDVVDEQIDVVGRSMLGLSIACARCHDHKFDPIPTTDYYAFAGIFASTDVLDGVIRRPRVSSRVDRLQGVAEPSNDDDMGETWDEFDSLEKAWAEAHAELARIRHKFPERVRQLRFNRRQIEMELDEVSKDIIERSGPSLVMAVADRQQPSDLAVRVRGETFSLGEVVPRGMLTVINQIQCPEIPKEASGRLELAQWIVSRDNPLTARVAVNRVWSKLFGTGIVATGDDFGFQGEAPSHPELLDTLAIQFMNDGWSTKRLIRRLVLSRTYGQSSGPVDLLQVETDGENRQLWRFSQRRLESEVIRDTMMQASGQLALKHPKQSLMLQFGTEELATDTDIGSVFLESQCRSVYLPMARGLLPEMLRLFDQADPNMVVSRRDTTGSPPQALFLMNSPFVIQQATQLAHRVGVEASDESARIELLYRMTLARAPNEREISAIRAFLSTVDPSDKAAREEAWATIAQTMLALPEFRYVF